MLKGDGTLSMNADYLPYGGLISGSGLNVTENDYLWTGKELQHQLFDTPAYDSNARLLFTNGLFASPDPLAEKYPGVSPYAYCAGNPIRRIDPDGRNPIVGALFGAAIEYAFQVYDNYQEGYTGKDAWYGEVDFADVTFSALLPGKKVSILGKMAVSFISNGGKEFFNFTPNNGFKVEDNKQDALVRTALDTAIDTGVDVAVCRAGQAADVADKQAKEASQVASKKRRIANSDPSSEKKERAAAIAEAMVQPSRNTQVGTLVVYNVLNDSQDMLKQGLQYWKGDTNQ